MRVLFYADAPNYGGHEAMMMEAVIAVAAQPGCSVALQCFSGNARLIAQGTRLANRLANFELIAQDYCSGRRQLLRHFLSFAATNRIAQRMIDFRPDIVITAQGGISYSSLGLKAARHVGARAICYIPMTHPEATWTTSKLKACLREWLSGFIYRLPDEYITISPRMAQYLHDRHLRQPIVVVPNGVDFASFQRIDRKAARAALGIPHDDVIIGMIGRVDFSQKRHDLALAALAQISGTRKPVRLLVVGEGPDLSRLKQLASDLGLLDRVIFIPWQDNTAAIYPILDMLLLPSAYEGVPLVMLEALFFEVPVVASAIDGMLDMLPSDWLFPSGDATALASRITDLIERDNSLALSKLRSKVLTENSIAEFRRRYAAAVTNAAGEHAPGRDRRLAT